MISSVAYKTSLAFLAAFVLHQPLLAQTAAVNMSSVGIANAAAVEGTVFVVRPDGKQALLTRGSNLQRGETINTARNSSVRLRFTDGGETVVRPESSMVVQDYQYAKEAPEQDSFIFKLLKGGLRAVTGAVGKRGNQNAYQMQVNTATIGIRGTDYSVRLCQKDCGDMVPANHQNSTTPVAARAVQVVGSATVSKGADKGTPLTTDKPLYTGDTVETGPGAYVVLVFRDNARITVNPNSRFVLTRYAYEPEPKGEPNSMFVELLKGGLRFATGLVGKSNPAMVKVRTATATIGIRGTVFDLACAPSVSSDAGSDAEVGSAPCDQALFAQTRDGTISMAGDKGGEILIAAGQSGRVDGPDALARPLSSIPEVFRNQKTPEPEGVTAVLPDLFGVAAPAETGNDVFVTVHEGRVVLAQEKKDITVDAGESAFIGGRSLVPVKLFTAPTVTNRDPFLSSGMFNASMCRR